MKHISRIFLILSMLLSTAGARAASPVTLTVKDPGDVYASWVNDETALRGWSYDEERPEDYKKLELSPS